MTLVDTPGFNDTEGIDRDKKIAEQIRRVFRNELTAIDMVCYVMPASQPRLTDTQKYIFDCITSLFGKDIGENIVMMFTFADAAQPTSLNCIKEIGMTFRHWFKFNNSGLYEKCDPMSEHYWTMNDDNLARWFSSLEKDYQKKSLHQSREVLNTREHLETVIANLQPIIDTQLLKIEEQRQIEVHIEHHESDMNANQDFTYDATVPGFRKIDLEPGRYVTNCLNCNRTCHFPCSFQTMTKRCIVLPWIQTIIASVARINALGTFTRTCLTELSILQRW
mmetsp:Transcript_30564/g.34751  ORF Transcript_30564/g.34751 Transcript_30564/m.34751 type:complete len:278 (+) Transcript_30564:622-1455(+)